MTRFAEMLRSGVGARHAVSTPPNSRFQSGSHRCISLSALAIAIVVLTGCAAGSPSVVGPVAPDASEVLIPEAPEAAQPAAAAREPTAPAAVPAIAIEEPMQSAPPQDPLDPAAIEPEPAAAETAAFAREAQAVADAAQAPAPAIEAPNARPSEPVAWAQGGRPPPPAAPGDGTILHYYRGPSDRLEVALTFDAGADRGYAAEILDELQARGVVATFGMTGQWAELNPDLIQRMVSEGHQLINHTWSHPSLTGASTGLAPITFEQLLTELTETETLIREMTGYELKPYFRPPYGDVGPVTSGYLAQAGYYVDALWSCDSFGWNGWTAADIVSRCTSAELGGPGAILLMHVGRDSASDLAALPELIDFYRSNGYAFVTIEQMLQP